MILVTGATGFLGAELVRQLAASGQQLRCLKRSSSTIPALLTTADIEWVDADILDYFALKDALLGVSEVYHCAALVSFLPSKYKEMMRVNADGTALLVNLCMEMGIRKLIHVSSVAALGEAKDGVVRERNFWEFDGSQKAYSISKYQAEMEVWRGIAEGLNAVVVNPSVIIGANAGGRGSGQIFATVKRGLPYYTSGSCALVDVQDVARAMVLLMNSDISAERFILNAGTLSNKAFFEEIAATYGSRPPKRLAGAFALGVAWRLAWLWSRIRDKEYAFNKEIAQSAQKKMCYSSDKFLEFFPDFTFRPIIDSIRAAAGA